MAGWPNENAPPVEKKIGKGRCHQCGAEITYERAEGEAEPIALDTHQQIATKANHSFLYRAREDRVFEPVTRPGQSGQAVHSATCLQPQG